MNKTSKSRWRYILWEIQQQKLTEPSSADRLALGCPCVPGYQVSQNLNAIDSFKTKRKSEIWSFSSAHSDGIKGTNRMTTTTGIIVIGHDDNINNDDDDGKNLMVDSEHHDTKNSSSCGQDHHSGIVHAWNHKLIPSSWIRFWTKAFVGIGWTLVAWSQFNAKKVKLWRQSCC